MLIWVNDKDLTVLPNPEIMVYIREIIPFYGRLNSGELWYAQIHGGTPTSAFVTGGSINHLGYPLVMSK